MGVIETANFLNFLDERNVRYLYGPPYFVPTLRSTGQADGASICQIFVPTGAVSGDAVWFFVLLEGGSSSHVTSVPSGFQEIMNNNDGVDVRGAVYAKTITSSEVGALATFGFDTSRRCDILGLVMKEAHTTDKRDDWLDNDTAASANITFSSLTSNVDRCLHVLVAFQDAIGNHTAPSGYNKHDELDGLFGTISVYSKYIETAGVTGAKVVTSSSAARWLAQSVTVPPFPDTA